MSARASIGRAWLREFLTYDLGSLKGPLGQASYGAAAFMAGLPHPALRSRAHGLLMRLHSAALSPRVDRAIAKRINRAVKARNDQPDSTSRLFQNVVEDAVNKFRADQNSQIGRLIGSRILVVKSSREGDRGVVVVDYQYVFPLLAGLFDLSRICERYDVVLEPSWAGACAPEILLFSRLQRPVYVQTIEPRDKAFIDGLNTNIQTVPLAANWWVDDRHPLPGGGPRDIDVIMVAAWADIKRHWRVFRALADLRRRGRKLKVALVGYRYDRTREDIEELAAYFGIRDQVETHERISQPQVHALLCRSKVHVLWSRRECANRAIVEAMMADVPVIVREGLTFGYRYPYVNEQTGRFVPEAGLADAILTVIDTRASFSPREWVLQNMTCIHATRILEDNLKASRRQRGEPWTGNLVVKTSTLDTQLYYNPDDRRRFDSDYAFLESTIRR